MGNYKLSEAWLNLEDDTDDNDGNIIPMVKNGVY